MVVMMKMVRRYLCSEKSGTVVAGIGGAAPAGRLGVDENGVDLCFVFSEMLRYPTSSSSISYSSSS